MKCWCDELRNYVCLNCEGKRKYESLSITDKHRAKELNRLLMEEEQDVASLYREIERFEAKHGDVTDYFFDGLL